MSWICECEYFALDLTEVAEQEQEETDASELDPGVQ